MDLYQELLKISENSLSIKELIEGMYRLINEPMAVVDSNATIVAYYPDKTSDKIWDENIKKGYWSLEIFKQVQESFLQSNSNSLIIDKISPTRRLFLKLEYKNKDIGFLIFLEEKTPFDEIKLQTREAFAALISKELFRLSPEILNSKRKTFLINAINGQFPSKEIFNNALIENKIQNDYSWRLLIFYIKEFKINLSSFFEDEIRSIFSTDLICYKDEYALVLLNKEITQKMIDDLDEYLFKSHMYALQSSKIIDLYNLNLTYERLKSLLNLLIEDKNEYRLLSEEENKELLSFINMRDMKNPLGFVSEKVIEMFKYDYENNTDYLNTLYIYLINEKSLSEASKQLYVHKNTILYRKERIEELFKINLDSHQIVFSLIYSILLINYLKKIKYPFRELGINMEY